MSTRLEREPDLGGVCWERGCGLCVWPMVPCSRHDKALDKEPDNPQGTESRLGAAQLHPRQDGAQLFTDPHVPSHGDIYAYSRPKACTFAKLSPGTQTQVLTQEYLYQPQSMENA